MQAGAIPKLKVRKGNRRSALIPGYRVIFGGTTRFGNWAFVRGRALKSFTAGWWDD